MTDVWFMTGRDFSLHHLVQMVFTKPSTHHVSKVAISTGVGMGVGGKEVGG
jgi:hypothetical protein